MFTGHQAALRSSLKRIRERDEALAELRNRRRNTGNKAENAERKLAKMGPENKSLPQQTDLLERLRQEMRQVSGDGVGGGELQLLMRNRWTRISSPRSPSLAILRGSESSWPLATGHVRHQTRHPLTRLLQDY